jgi:plasmid maintenance system killer protein
MIRSFKHRGLKRFYEREDRSGIRPDLVKTVQEILTGLDAAGAQSSRIVFRFEGTDAFDIELIDYH